MKFLLFAFICLLSANTGLAQAHSAWLDRGAQAFAEQRYDDAEAAYRWIIEREPENAAVRYVLAQVLLAKGEKKAADRSIVRALKSAPENVAYLELQLQIGFPREPLEILRKARRDELATKILLLDSLSVPPNIQLGQSMMKEWLKWRGRISISGLTPMAAGNLGSTRPSANNVRWKTIDQLQVDYTFSSASQPLAVFNVERQKKLGYEVLDMSEAAEQSYPQAIAYLRRALVREPANQTAHLDLARLFMTRPDMPALNGIAQSLQEHDPQNYYAWLLGGYAQHHLVNEAAAEQQFEEAIRLMPDSLKGVYEDIHRIMNKAGLEQKDRHPDFNTEDFWDYRDPRLLTPQNERITEHYARVLFADLLFSEPKLNLAGWDSERGEVYIRYGAPQTEYYVSNELAKCGAATYENFHVFEYPAFKFVFGNLWPHLNQYVYYSPCSQVFATRAAVGAPIDYQIIAKENIRQLPDAFYYDASGKRVAFPYLTSSFKGNDGSVDLYVPYGIPVTFSALHLTQTLGLQAGAFLFSEENGMHDEQRHAVQDIRVRDITSFEDGALWLDIHQLRASPGVYDLSVEFETATGAGAGFYRSSIEVPAFESDHLKISDLLLAYAVEEATAADVADLPAGMLHRDGLLIKPAPWGVFNKEQPMYLYFEMYNLEKSTVGRSGYEVEAVLVEYRDDKGLSKLLKRAFRGKEKEGVSVRFENTSTNADEGQYLILDTKDQPAGRYVVVMRVTDLISKKTVESRRIVLLE